jgi:hypothetical protein
MKNISRFSPQSGLQRIQPGLHQFQTFTRH